MNGKSPDQVRSGFVCTVAMLVICQIAGSGVPAYCEDHQLHYAAKSADSVLQGCMPDL